MPTTASATIIGPTDGESVQLQTIGVRFMIPGADSDTRFSLVEHPMPPRGLAAPLHRHNREDEYSFILEGRMGALLGDEVVEAGPGDLVYKLRGQWHTFWNAGDEPAHPRDHLTRRFRDVLRRARAARRAGGALDPEVFGELCGRYALDMQPESVPELCSRFGVWFPGVE